MNDLLQRIIEADYKDVVRKQKSITRLFPEFADRVKQIGKKGGLRLVSVKPEEWFWKIHSGTKDSVWYDAHLKFKNIKEMLKKHVPDKRLWTRDKSRVDLKKLAKAMIYRTDIQLDCSCPAQKYYGGDYILSLDKYDAKYGDKEKRAPNKRNPKQYGMVCKHLQNLINVLPFYETTFAKWLKDFYYKDIQAIEEITRSKSDFAKLAGKALGGKKADISTRKAVSRDIKKKIQPPLETKPEIEEPTEEVIEEPIEEPTKKSIDFTKTVKVTKPKEDISTVAVEEPKKESDKISKKSIGKTKLDDEEISNELDAETETDFAEPIPLPSAEEIQEEPIEEEEPNAAENPETAKKKKKKLQQEDDIETVETNENIKTTNEKFTTVYRTIVHINPSRIDADIILKKSRYKELRGLITPNNTLYLWDADKLLHYVVIDSLNLGDKLDMEYLNIKNSAIRYPQPIFAGERGLDYWKDINKSRTEISKANTHTVNFSVNECIKSRLGDCYRLSGRYVSNNHNAILVHGIINGKKFTGKDFDNPHAWVEYDDKVYDPVWDQEFPKEVYYTIMQAKVIKKYNWEEAAVAMLKNEHWGPWNNINEAMSLGILSYFPNISGGILKVISDNGTLYSYKKVSPHMYDKIEKWLKYKRFGQTWQFLRNLEQI